MNYSNIRGFNCLPGYAATGLEIWALKFDAGRIEDEIARCKTYFPRTNLLRLWLSFDAYLHARNQFAANFAAVLWRPCLTSWDTKEEERMASLISDPKRAIYPVQFNFSGECALPWPGESSRASS